AQQTAPVKRLVAVKLIKAGMDSKAGIARFEAERQALALMDHPNIAKVLDAGTTNPKSQKPKLKQAPNPKSQSEPKEKQDIGASDLGLVCDLDSDSWDFGAGTTNPKSQKPKLKQPPNPKSPSERQEMSDIGASDLGPACELDFDSRDFGLGRPYFVMELVKG